MSKRNTTIIANKSKAYFCPKPGGGGGAIMFLGKPTATVNPSFEFKPTADQLISVSDNF